MTDKEKDAFIRDLAQRTYSSEGCVEIDEDAEISYGDDDGAYVKAWVWVSFCDTPLSKDCSECGETREECLCVKAGDGICSDCSESYCPCDCVRGKP